MDSGGVTQADGVGLGWVVKNFILELGQNQIFKIWVIFFSFFLGGGLGGGGGGVGVGSGGVGQVGWGWVVKNFILELCQNQILEIWVIFFGVGRGLGGTQLWVKLSWVAV